MSSVRISQHSRAAAASSSSRGETGKTEAPTGVAGFAAALGAAGFMQKGPGTATPFDVKGNDAADGAGATRKRTGSEGKSGNAAAILAAQASLLPIVGQAPFPPHDTVDAAAAPTIVSAADLESPSMPGTGQPAANFASPEIAPADASATSSSYPGGTPIATVLRNLDNPPPTAMAADVATAVPIPGDAAVNLSGALPTLRPQLASTSSVSLAPVQPALTGTAQAILPAAAGEMGADNSDAASGDEKRERFASVAVASADARAVEAAALGAPSEPTALASAPATMTSPVIGADTSATATVASQVANHVLRLVSSGSREMEMRLHPPELGEVTVRVAVNGRDVSAWFGSPQPHVQTAIADGIGQLQAGLGNAGYNLNGAWVGANASDARQSAGRPLPVARVLVAAHGADVGMTAASRSPAPGLNIYV